jgi:hypothetical protein
LTHFLQEKVTILERKLVDKDINSNGLHHNESDIEVDRDEDNQSPQAHHVHYDANGRDGHYLEIPPQDIQVSSKL